jgi:hypothetical protein
MIPESPVETQSTAERRLFERLSDDAPQEIVAFDSVAWQLPGRKGRPEQGEADFVLAHPDYGVLTLEVNWRDRHLAGQRAALSGEPTLSSLRWHDPSMVRRTYRTHAGDRRSSGTRWRSRQTTTGARVGA